MIEIKNFSKSYGGNSVYEHFDLSLEEGKITCILGASGSGKTTLLNAVAGLIKAEGELPKLKCSYIFQNSVLVPNLTVRKNLGLVCGDENQTDEMLEKIGLGGKAQKYPVNLSGGEARRVAIARAFLYKSDILLMDEPFSSLDIKLKYAMLGLFFEIWRRDGRTVLMVTHDVDEAVSAAQRIIILSHGKIAADLSPGEDVPRKPADCAPLREKTVELLLNCV